MNREIQDYNDRQAIADKEICDFLLGIISNELNEAECKIWHGHPVWFLDGNPVAGYSRQKKGIRLMFWSGAEFLEEEAVVKGKKFKDASLFFEYVNQIDILQLTIWLKKSREIQWDYKNIVKRKGELVRLK